MALDLKFNIEISYLFETTVFLTFTCDRRVAKLENSHTDLCDSCYKTNFRGDQTEHIEMVTINISSKSVSISGHLLGLQRLQKF